MTEKTHPCSLVADELRDRKSTIRAEILPLVRKRDELADGFRCEFDDTPQLRQKLEDFVAFERECCSGVDWQLRSEAAGLVLEVHGLDPDLALLAATPSPQPSGGVSRIAKAGGIGAVGAVIVLCVLPMAVAAVAGATIAAPLAGLESPSALGAGTLLLGGSAWWLLRRREERRGC